MGAAAVTTQRPLAILVSPVLPAPTGSGRALRAWSWLAELADDHEVHVLVPELEAEADAAPQPLAGPLSATLWRCRAGFDVGRRLAKAAGLALPPLALAARRFVRGWYYRTEQPFAAGLVAAIGARPVARIVVFRHYLADLGEALALSFPVARLELDLDDLESQTRLSLAGAHLALGEAAEAVAVLSSAAQFRLMESRLPGRFARLWLAADEDRATLQRRGVGPLAVRPNRIAMLADVPPALPAGDLRLLFVGTLNYAPNGQAVQRLLRHVVPALRGQLGNWRLTIVGRHADPTLVAELSRAPEVDFIADAEDLSPLYRATQIALVPLATGGGTKLKTIEAFANRRAVISTRHGVRGLAATPGRDFVPAESDADFVAAILALAADRERADRVAQAGWTLAREHYALNKPG